LAGILLSGYILLSSIFFHEWRTDGICNGLQVMVKDSLEKHFVTDADLLGLLNRAGLDPVGKSLSGINTDLIETELLKNDMIAEVQAYKTPSGKIKLEITQKIPVIRILSAKGSYYIDNRGGYMPLSTRYTAHVPVASGYIEREFAETQLYEFACFLEENEFWNDQIDQIYVRSADDVELIPRVGGHHVILGSFMDYREKLENLQLFYRQVIPKMGWDKYSVINLSFRDQIVCTKKQ